MDVDGPERGAVAEPLPCLSVWYRVFWCVAVAAQQAALCDVNVVLRVHGLLYLLLEAASAGVPAAHARVREWHPLLDCLLLTGDDGAVFESPLSMMAA